LNVKAQYFSCVLLFDYCTREKDEHFAHFCCSGNLDSSGKSQWCHSTGNDTRYLAQQIYDDFVSRIKKCIVLFRFALGAMNFHFMGVVLLALYFHSRASIDGGGGGGSCSRGGDEVRLGLRGGGSPWVLAWPFAWMTEEGDAQPYHFW
jgi:hypothetical protein